MVDREDLRVAVIGCGFQGSFHADAMSRVPGARVAITCDEDPDAAELLAGRHPGAAASTDWAGTIGDPSIDAVVIATPSHTHTELALAAAAAAKPMLLEKPMATTIDECLRIEAAVSAAGVPLIMGFKFRFAPAVLRAKEAVPTGRILTAHTLYDTSQITTSWVADPDKSGGRVTSSLVHTVDLLRFLTDSEPVRVTAEGIDIIDSGEPTTIVATVRFESGAIASVVHGSSTQSGLLSAWSFTTSTEEASATLFDHCRRVAVRVDAQNEDVFVDEVEDAFATGMAGLASAFVDAARTSSPMLASSRDGVVSLATCRAIELAADSGQSQEVEIPQPL